MKKQQSKSFRSTCVGRAWKVAMATFLCLLATLPSLAQTRSVRGTVIDSQGEPVIGASVLVNGDAKRGTITDIDGVFNIQAAPGEKLKITYIGCKDAEVLADKSNLKITLQEDNKTLDEVVVVGYGTQKKATLTGAVSQVDNKEINVTKNENVVNMISGKIPGVRISQRSSQPGEFDNAIDIRGLGEPLIVVDGIPRDKDYFSRMDASEIETVSVLKDASASIYGVRAANGVLLVTTKHGSSKDGKFNVTLSANFGWQSFLYVPKTTDAATYMQITNEKTLNSNFSNNYFATAAPKYSQEQIDEYLSGKKHSTNWSDEMFKNITPQEQYNISIDGGSGKVNYYFNLGYLKQDGAYKSGSLNYDRWNFRSNVDAQITNNLKATVQLSGYMDEKNQPFTDIWAVYKKAWTYRPTAQAYVDGNHSLPAWDDDMNESENPVAAIDSNLTGYRRKKQYNFNGSLALTYNIPGVKGLNAKAFYSYDYYNTNNTNYKRAYTLFKKGEDGTLQRYSRNSDSYLQRESDPAYGTVMQLSLNYAHKFGDHNISAMALFEEQYNNYDNFYAQRYMKLDGQYIIYGEDNGQIGNANKDGIWDKTRQAFVGHVNYDYLGRYIADFSFRYDGSSSFPKDSRWGFFPAVSVGWRISEEPWMKKAVPFMDNLKLRLSYGEMGDDSGNSIYPPTIVGYNLNPGQVDWIYGGSVIAGVVPTAIPNPSLTWLKAKTYNIGVDFDLWNQKLGGTVEVFKRKRSGLFGTSAVVVPGTVGATMPNENLNSDETYGWEISLTHRNTIAGVSYWVNGQISATKNRWDKYVNAQASNEMANWYRSDVSGRNKDIWFAYEEGGRFQNYDQIRNHTTTGVNVNNATLPGDYWYKDWNGDGIVDDNDKHPVATFNLPVFNYGINMGATWKGIDLSMNWQGAAGVYNSYTEVFEQAGAFGGAVLTRYLDRWHTANVGDDPWNPATKWIKGEYPATGHSFVNGTTGIHNTSYIRLKTLEIGYTLPKAWLKSAGINDIRVYFNAYNLLTFTGNKDMDPERPGNIGGASGYSSVNTPGYDGFVNNYNYPVNRTFNVGATVKF